MNAVNNIALKQSPMLNSNNLTFMTTKARRKQKNNDILVLTEQREKEQKQEKRNKWLAIAGIATGISFVIMAIGSIIGHAVSAKTQKVQRKYFEEATKREIEATKALRNESKKEEGGVSDIITKMWRDITGEKSLEDLALPDTLEAAAKQIRNSIEFASRLRGMGSQPISSILLYGPPGTGKTAFSMAIAKGIKNCDFAYLDVGTMKDMYHGGSEKKINAMIDAICERAQKYIDEYKTELGKVIGEDLVKSGDQKAIDLAIEQARKDGKTLPELKRVFVLADEIDSIMMVDESTGKKLSQDMLNEFKKGFTDKLGRLENITVIGCTNLTINPESYQTLDGKVLDKAMLDRFNMKVLVDNPTSEQLKNTILGKYKNCDSAFIADELKTDNPRLQSLCDFLAVKEHNFSFRDLLNSLLKGTSNSMVSEKRAMNIDDICNELLKTFNNFNMDKNTIQKDIEEIRKGTYKPPRGD